MTIEILLLAIVLVGPRLAAAAVLLPVVWISIYGDATQSLRALRIATALAQTLGTSRGLRGEGA